MERIELNFGDRRTMDRKGYPPFEDLLGTDDDTGGCRSNVEDETDGRIDG